MSNTSLLGSFGGQAGESLMFRNRLINGGFDVWQRGTSQTLTGAAGYFTADRWYISSGGSPGVMTSTRQESGVTESAYFQSRYFYRHNQTTANTSNGRLYQRIESVWTFSGQVATLSFWMKANKNLTISLKVVQSFGTGGTPSAEVNVLTQSIALTTTWTKYTITTPIFPSVNGKTLGTDNNDAVAVLFDFPPSDTYIVDAAEVQLEAGPTATPFERRPYSVEELLCKRYCHVTTGGLQSAGSSTSAASWVISHSDIFPVQMRAMPIEAGTGSVTVDLANALGTSVGSATMSISIWGPLSARLEVIPGVAASYFRSPSRQRIYSAEL